MEQTEIFKRIREGRYGASAAEILEFGQEVSDFNKQIGGSRKKKLLDSENIHSDTWAKVVVIGEAQHLHDKHLSSILPSSLSILASIARLSKTDFKHAVEEGLIRPQLTYRELMAWKKNRGSTESVARAKIKLLPYVIAVEANASVADELKVVMKIQEALEEINARGQLITVDPWETIESQAQLQWQSEIINAEIKAISSEYPELKISKEDFEASLTDLISSYNELTEAQMERLCTLKVAFDSIFSKTKQKRYSCRLRLISQAKDGNELARRLTSDLLGET